MAVAVLCVDVTVVIDEVFVAGVVGWVDVDYVDAALVGVAECCKGLEIVPFDNNVIR